MTKKPDTCAKCPLYLIGEGFVRPKHYFNPSAVNKMMKGLNGPYMTMPKLLIQGEAPGRNEVQAGEPFIGMAGQWLRRNILSNAGVRDEEVVFDNTIRCLVGGVSGGYPTGKNRREAEAACRQYDIWSKFPAVPLLLVGGKAIGCRLEDDSVGKWNGHIEFKDGRFVGATYHPSAVQRNPNLLPLVVQHVRNLLKVTKDQLSRPLVKKGYIPHNDQDFVFDLEWNSETEEIICYGVAYEKDKAFSTYDPDAGEYIVSRITDGTSVVGGHNIIDADLPLLGFEPVWIRDNADRLFDTMIAAHLVHPHFAETGLYGLSDMVKYYEPTGEWKHDKGDLLEYNGRDCAYNYRLLSHLKRDLAITNQSHLLPFQQQLAAMALGIHQKGIRLDVPALEEYARNLKRQREEYKSGLAFNPNSPKQIKEWAAGRGIKLKDTTFETLKKYEGKDEEFDRLIDYREDSKSLSTWFPFAEDGTITADRIHPHIHVTGTNVFRPSSSDPNILNISEGGIREMADSRTRSMPNLRRFLLAEPDSQIWSFDYSSIEHRTVAWHAEDWKKLKDLDSGIKTYTKVAARHYGKQYNKVTKAEYRMAKTVVLASDYLETPYNLANRLFGKRDRESVSAAFKLQQSYFAEYPATAAWHKRLSDQLAITLINPFGYRRKVYAQDSHERAKRGVHYMGCSTATCAVGRRGVEIWKELGLIPFMWVYDELAYCLPLGKEGIKLAKRIWEIMEQPFAELPGLRLPVECEVGPNYGNLTAIGRLNG